MKRNLSIIVLILVFIGITSCAQKKYARIETTEMQRYNIVYDKSGKCGIYDNNADSLVTAVKYDRLRFGELTSEQGYEFTMWAFIKDSSTGLISVGLENNLVIEMTFPEE